MLPLLHLSRHIRSAHPRHFGRPFSANKRPEWMIQAEQEALAASSARAVSTPNGRMMDKLTHEFNSERVSNSVRLEDKLKQLIAKANQAKSGATDKKGRMVYTAIRKKALETRQDLITQREAAGMATDATSAVEAAYPIPTPV